MAAASCALADSVNVGTAGANITGFQGGITGTTQASGRRPDIIAIVDDPYAAFHEKALARRGETSLTRRGYRLASL